MNNQINKVKEYFFNVDFLRFIFAFFIVNQHLFDKYYLGVYKEVYGEIALATRTCYISVDYFFIIAGFFLLFTFKDMPVIDFIKKKICKFWPLMLLLYILYACLGQLEIIKFNWYSNTMSLFFLENIGITIQKSNIGITWFLSSLLFVSIFYYYIYKHFKKENSDLATCLLTLFAYIALIYFGNGTISGDRIITREIFFNNGMLRAIAGMGLGIIVFNIYTYFKNQNYTYSVTKFVSASVVELFLLWFVIYETGLHKLAFKNKIILILAFAVLLVFFALKRGIISKILNNRALANLGKYALAIYLTHIFVILFYMKIILVKYATLINNHPLFVIVLIYLSIGVFAFLAHHFVEKPGVKFLSDKLLGKKETV